MRGNENRDLLELQRVEKREKEMAGRRRHESEEVFILSDLEIRREMDMEEFRAG